MGQRSKCGEVRKKSLLIKEKVDISHNFKVNNICLKNQKGVQSPSRKWRLLATHTADKGLASKPHKALLQIIKE